MSVAIRSPSFPANEIHRMVILDESDFLLLEEDHLRPAVLDGADAATKPTPFSHGSEAITALLSVQRVAEITMYSTKTVRRRIESGDLRAVYDQGLLRVREDDLRAYIDGLQERGSADRRRRSIRGSRGWSGLP